MCSQAVVPCVVLHSCHRDKVAVHQNTLMSTALGLAVLQVRLVTLFTALRRVFWVHHPM